MKKFLKNEKFTIISFSILMIWGVFALLSCKNDNLLSDDPLILYFHLFADKNLYYLEILAPIFIFVPAIYFAIGDTAVPRCSASYTGAS